MQVLIWEPNDDTCMHETVLRPKQGLRQAQDGTEAHARVTAISGRYRDPSKGYGNLRTVQRPKQGMPAIKLSYYSTIQQKKIN